MKPKRIPIPTLDIYSQSGEIIGKDLNELEITHFLYQIAIKRLSGYYFINDEGEKEIISDLGEMVFPKRFSQDFDLIHALAYLQCQIRIENNI